MHRLCTSTVLLDVCELLFVLPYYFFYYYCLHLPAPPKYVGSMIAPEDPTMRATVAPWAKMRARIIVCDMLWLPALNATKPAHSTAPVMPAPARDDERTDERGLGKCFLINELHSSAGEKEKKQVKINGHEKKLGAGPRNQYEDKHAPTSTSGLRVPLRSGRMSLGRAGIVMSTPADRRRNVQPLTSTVAQRGAGGCGFDTNQTAVRKAGCMGYGIFYMHHNHIIYGATNADDSLTTTQQ